MKTVFDVIEKNSGCSVVMVQRHYSYLMGPVEARYPDSAAAYAANYSEVEPSVLFLCDKAGIEHGWRHGKQFAEAGIEITEIVASHQGRGPDSGLRISEGHYETIGKWIPVRCHRAVDYPVYNYQAAYKCLSGMENADPMVAQWINGKRDDLVSSDTPHSFFGRTIGFTEDLLKTTGVKIVTTHFEAVTVSHNIMVAQKKPGSFSESWSPPKGGGVIIVRRPGEQDDSRDYDSDLNLV